jgi:hypothetical protein
LREGFFPALRESFSLFLAMLQAAAAVAKNPNDGSSSMVFFPREGFSRDPRGITSFSRILLPTFFLSERISAS